MSAAVTAFKTLDDADLAGQRALVRVDLNVPMEDGKVTDTTRIDRILPTIREIAAKGAKVILLAHFGRPKGPDTKNSLKQVVPALAHALGSPVTFVDDCIGDDVASPIRRPRASRSSSRPSRPGTRRCAAWPHWAVMAWPCPPPGTAPGWTTWRWP